MGFLNSDKLIVGYDLGNKNSQISYAVSETGEVETLSMVAGAQSFNIPTVLCKRSGVNQWFCGREAVRYAQEHEGILVENLLDLALDGEPVIIEGESFEPVALLALFFKRSLGNLSQVGAADKIAALMITCPTMDRKMKEVLSQVIVGLHMKPDRVFFQSHTESFYNYMLHQPKELWLHKTVLFHYREKDIKVYTMECNRRTTPIVSFIEEKEYPLWPSTVPAQKADENMLQIAEAVCEDRLIAGVYLIGDGFAGDWSKETLRYLCKGKRVFQGNNLFSKGACFGMQERLSVSEVGKSYVFLGRDKLKANIGMKILRNGADSYYALLNAGENWYEAEHTAEFYVQNGNDLELTVTSLIGKHGRTRTIHLDGLEDALIRLRLHLFLEAENVLVAEAEDLGFGEFRAPSGRTWCEKIDIYEEE